MEENEKHSISIEFLKEIRDKHINENNARYEFMNGVIKEFESGKSIKEIVDTYRYILDLIEKAEITK